MASQLWPTTRYAAVQIAYTRLALELLQRQSGTVGSDIRSDEAEPAPNLHLVHAQEAS